MKTCLKCKEEKPLSEFYKKKGKTVALQDYYTSPCKACTLAQNKSYAKANKEKRQATKAKWRKANREIIAEKQKANYQENWNKRRAQANAYREKNKESINAQKRATYDKEKARESFQRYYATEKGRGKMRAYARKHKDEIKALQRNKYKNDPIYRLQMVIRTTVKKVLKKKGYEKNSSTEEILGISYQELGLYLKGLLPDGLSLEKAHVDHIVPLSLAQTEEEVLALNHHSNLRPLSAKENLLKGSKLDLTIISPENKIRYKEIIERAQK